MEDYTHQVAAIKDEARAKRKADCRPASSGNGELLCVCQGGWMCPNCRDKLEFENHEMKRRIDEACRMMREGDFSLEMSAVGDEFLMMVSQQIQAIKHT